MLKGFWLGVLFGGSCGAALAWIFAGMVVAEYRKLHDEAVTIYHDAAAKFAAVKKAIQ